MCISSEKVCEIGDVSISLTTRPVDPRRVTPVELVVEAIDTSMNRVTSDGMSKEQAD